MTNVRRKFPRGGRVARCAATVPRAALAAVLIAGCAPRPEPPGDVAPGAPAVWPETYAHSIAALGFPAARRAFQVGDGSLVSNGDVTLTWRWRQPAGDTTTSPVRFERDGVPVAHWTATDGAHEVAFEAAAAPVPALGDTSLLLSVRVTATRRAPGRGRFALEAAAATVVPGPHALPWDAPAPGEPRLVATRGRVTSAGRLAIDLPRGVTAAPAGVAAARVAMELDADLGSGESRTWTFRMPLYPVGGGGGRDRAGIAAVAAGTHERVTAECRRRWRAWLARGAALETPDARVNQAWRAALVTLLVCQERARDRWLPIGSPFQYRDVWIRDGARVVRALAVSGFADVARDDARSLARFQFPGGALVSQPGQLDGTGQALWAFDQASALPPSAETARALLPFARPAVEWIEQTRARTEALDLPWGGLLPFGDPRDNELVRAELVGNDAWALAGLRSAAALGARAGDTALVRRAEAARRDHLAAFRAALARTRHPDVPPSWRGPGRDWGNLSVCYPTGVIAPGDPRMARLDARMSVERTRSGLVRSGSPDSLHTYLGADLAEWALLAGRPAAARRWLAGVLDHSSATLGQAEVFHRNGDFGTNLPPHGTAAAMLVDLLRNMVVNDTRDTLEFALGGDPSWWEGTRLERAPTRFGVVDVSLGRAGDTLVVRHTPVDVPVRVRVPDGARAVAALTDGAGVAGDYVQGDGRRGTIAFRVVEVAAVRGVSHAAGGAGRTAGARR